MIFGMCIDYRSAGSIGIRIVLYLKRTLELLISTDVLVRLVCFGMFNGTDLINMDVLLPVRMGKKT